MNHPMFEYKFTTGGPEGTFEGYGAVFNNEDDGGDMLLPGCFDRTLAQHKAAGTMPKMLLSHGGMAWGSPTPDGLVPIGKWTDMTPDSRGLLTKGRLINLDTDRGKTIYGAMKEGELSGLSMGYKVIDFTRGTKPNEPRRTIKAVDLIEVSPVTFPMNPLATVTDVKDGSSFAGQSFTTMPRFIEGIAISFNEPHFFKFEDFVDVFAPGCAVLTDGQAIDFIEDHDVAKKIASTDDGSLELHADYAGLNFRVRMPEDATGKRIFGLVEAGLKNCMSPGYKVVKANVSLCDGCYVRTLREIKLNEISLVPQGIIPSSFAVPVIGEDSAFIGGPGDMLEKRGIVALKNSMRAFAECGQRLASEGNYSQLLTHVRKISAQIDCFA